MLMWKVFQLRPYHISINFNGTNISNRHLRSFLSMPCRQERFPASRSMIVSERLQSRVGGFLTGLRTDGHHACFAFLSCLLI